MEHTMGQIMHQFIYICRVITSIIIIFDIILVFTLLPVFIIAYIMHIKSEKYIRSKLLEDLDEPEDD